MRPLKPAQAGFPPASRDFSRQAAIGSTSMGTALRAYPKNWNLFACGVIAVRAAGLFR